jgi:hypothetical protein
VVLPIAIALAGCGESQQEKAQKTVCSAKAEIRAKVQHLTTITPSSTAATEVKDDLTAIGDDLTKIKQAQPDLAPARKQEVEHATQEFTALVGANIPSIVASLAKGEVNAQLKTSFERLLTAYQKALGPINCS